MKRIKWVHTVILPPAQDHTPKRKSDQFDDPHCQICGQRIRPAMTARNAPGAEETA